MGIPEKVEAPKAHQNKVSSEQSSVTNAKVVSERAADETLDLLEQHGSSVGVLTPEAEKKLTRKIRFHVLVLVMIIDLMLFVC